MSLHLGTREPAACLRITDLRHSGIVLRCTLASHRASLSSSGDPRPPGAWACPAWRRACAREGHVWADPVLSQVCLPFRFCSSSALPSPSPPTHRADFWGLKLLWFALCRVRLSLTFFLKCHLISSTPSRSCTTVSGNFRSPPEPGTCAAGRGRGGSGSAAHPGSPLQALLSWWLPPRQLLACFWCWLGLSPHTHARPWHCSSVGSRGAPPGRGPDRLTPGDFISRLRFKKCYRFSLSKWTARWHLARSQSRAPVTTV